MQNMSQRDNQKTNIRLALFAGRNQSAAIKKLIDPGQLRTETRILKPVWKKKWKNPRIFFKSQQMYEHSQAAQKHVEWFHGSIKHGKQRVLL